MPQTPLAPYAPADRVAHQGLVGRRLPGIAEGERRLTLRIDATVDGGLNVVRRVMAVAEGDVGHTAPPQLACVAQHAGLAVRLQRGIRLVDRADGRRDGIRAVLR